MALFRELKEHKSVERWETETLARVRGRRCWPWAMLGPPSSSCGRVGGGWRSGIRSRHSRRSMPTQHSAHAFALGVEGAAELAARLW